MLHDHHKNNAWDYSSEQSLNLQVEYEDKPGNCKLSELSQFYAWRVYCDVGFLKGEPHPQHTNLLENCQEYQSHVHLEPRENCDCKRSTSSSYLETELLDFGGLSNGDFAHL